MKKYKIVISDYENALQTDLSKTIDSIGSILPKAEVVRIPYVANEEFYTAIEDADGLICAYIPIDEDLLNHAPKLKCISVNATGYSNVDFQATKKRNIVVCNVGEYCTQEVAEHTMAFIFALNRNLKGYGYQIEQEKKWDYAYYPGGKTLCGQTMAIFGFGKIGRMVSKMAKALGLHVLVKSDWLSDEEAEALGVEKVTAKEAFARADIISNHMSLTSKNYHYFDASAFEEMKKMPLFINVGRGGSVDETALVAALDAGKIRGAGLDVLEKDYPDLKKHPLISRENVIITPHCAFYSEESLERLQIISGQNMAYALLGKMGNCHIVN